MTAPEPTDYQWAVAAELLQCEKADDDFPYCDWHGGSWPCSDMTRVARALAAAVAAEREKYLRVAEELEAEAEANQWLNGLNQWETHYPEFVDAARRIREVSR